MANFNNKNLLDRKLFSIEEDALTDNWYILHKNTDWISWFFTTEEKMHIYTVTKNSEFMWFYFQFFNREGDNYGFYPMYKSKNIIYDILIMFGKLKIDKESLKIDF
jgi:hypothetical protein